VHFASALFAKLIHLCILIAEFLCLVLQIEDSSSHVGGVSVRIYLLDCILEQLLVVMVQSFGQLSCSNLLQRSFLPVYQMIEQSHQKRKTFFLKHTRKAKLIVK